MNKEIKDKNLSQHINDKEDNKEMASNFTHQVMSQVEQLEIKNSITDKPLIGVVGWMMFTLFGGLIIYSITAATQSTDIDFTLPDFDFVQIKKYSGITIATLLAVCGLILIDILLRKSKKKKSAV